MSANESHLLWKIEGLWFSYGGKPLFYMKRSGVSNKRPKFETDDGKSFLFYNYTWMYYVDRKKIWIALTCKMRDLEKKFEELKSDDLAWCIETTDESGGGVTVCSIQHKQRLEKKKEEADQLKKQQEAELKAQAEEKCRTEAASKLEAEEKARQLEAEERKKVKREAILKDKERAEEEKMHVAVHKRIDEKTGTNDILVDEEVKVRPRFSGRDRIGPFFSPPTDMHKRKKCITVPCSASKSKGDRKSLRRCATSLNSANSKHFADWTAEEVATWVSGIAPVYSRYRDLFCNEGIDGDTLIEDYNLFELIRIGVKKQHALNILRKVKALDQRKRNSLLMYNTSRRMSVGKQMRQEVKLFQPELYQKLNELSKTCGIVKDCLKALETEIKCALELKVNPPDKMRSKDGFLSHDHKRHGDFCRSLAFALKSHGATVNFNSLEDIMKHRKTIDRIANSNEFVLLINDQYFERQCMFEYLVALALEKPVTVLLECDPRFGGFAIADFDRVIPEVFRNRIKSHEIIMVHRDYFNGMVEKVRVRMVRHKEDLMTSS